MDLLKELSNLENIELMNHWNVILTGNTHFSVCIICVKSVSLPVYSGEYLDQSDKLGFFSIS